MWSWAVQWISFLRTLKWIEFNLFQAHKGVEYRTFSDISQLISRYIDVGTNNGLCCALVIPVPASSGQVKGQVEGQVRDQVTSQAKGQVSNQAKGQVSNQVKGQLGGQVKGQDISQVKGQVTGQAATQEEEEEDSSKLSLKVS